jgi:pyrroloquinoline quinone biosynthesis protein B
VKRLLFSVISVLAVSPGSPLLAAEPSVRAVVLGIAQDGGVPHIGCRQELCEGARRDARRRERVASLGLVDERSGQRFLVDATPDVASQIDTLNRGRTVVDARRPVEGILLTHAHVGHYAGLMFLGREALGARGVPVYATPRMARFLRDNGPWSQLVALGNIELRDMEVGRELALTPHLRVTPLAVPHRDEFSDTVGFRIRGGDHTLLYIPDVDKWERWDRDVRAEVAAVDVAVLDGTFADAAEIPGRTQVDIPHPLVPDTTARLGGVAARVLFTHLNHTNALLRGSPPRDGRGFTRAVDGQVIPLAR